MLFGIEKRPGRNRAHRCAKCRGGRAKVGDQPGVQRTDERFLSGRSGNGRIRVRDLKRLYQLGVEVRARPDLLWMPGKLPIKKTAQAVHLLRSGDRMGELILLLIELRLDFALDGRVLRLGPEVN